MAVPPTVAEANAAVPPTGTPVRSLTNQFLKDVIATLALKADIGTERYVEVANFAALPASPATGDTYVVLAASGVPFINKKEAGLYRWSGTAWLYLGPAPEGYFTDNVLSFFDDVDPTKQAKLQLSGITPGTVRTLSWPNADGTIALTGHTHVLANITDVSMTASDLNSLDDGADTTLHFHAADRARANHTGTQLASTISDFNTAADARVAAAVGTSVQAFDADLSAIAALAGTSGLARKTAANTWTLDTNAYLTGNQTITCTGDVTGSGSTSVTLAIGAGTVSLSKMANLAPNSIIGNNTGVSAAPTALSATQVRTLLNVADGATSNATDASLRDRGTHTGTQLASTISDFASTVAATAAVTANTAKVTNQTHTGDVTGATALTISDDVVSNLKLSNMAANTVKVRAAATVGDPSDLALAASQLLGRGSTGDIAPITLGANLTMTGTTLSASGGGGGGSGLTAAETRRRIFLGA